MGVIWSDITIENTNCNVLNEPMKLEDFIYICREQFDNAIVGCCGSIRKDSLQPDGFSDDIKSFKQRCKKLMNNYLLKKEDSWYIERYKTLELSDFRGNEPKIHEFYLNKETDIWSYYYKEKLEFSVSTIEQVDIKWIIG